MNANDIIKNIEAEQKKAEITEDLLEEVLYLVEYPTALCGKFEEKYLELPPETVITPMRDHQRYFPVKTADGKLLPLFITVRNGGSEHLEAVEFLQKLNENIFAEFPNAMMIAEESTAWPMVSKPTGPPRNFFIIASSIRLSV